MLSRIQRSISYNKLHLGGYESAQAPRTVIFGANAQVAPYIAHLFRFYRPRYLFPLRTHAKNIDPIKNCSAFKDITVWPDLDLQAPGVLDRIVEGSDIVINLIGAHRYIRDYDFIYESNVTLPRMISEAVARNGNVKRFIHFSAAGASPDSNSSFLKTKWLGEQDVKSIYPEVTVMRPCLVYGQFDQFISNYSLLETWLGFMYVIDDGSVLRQPICASDIGQAVVNALKLEESVGKTYELGGPYVYTMLEMLEIIYNKIGRPPNVKSIPYNTAHRIISKVPHIHGITRFMSVNSVQESKIDITVSPDANKIEDLYVKPVSFPQNIKRYVTDIASKTFLTRDEYESGWFGGHDRYYDPQGIFLIQQNANLIQEI